jgi:NDP-sugar pyrophosphorylase family protein
LTDPQGALVNQLTLLERFDLPEALAARLPLLDTLLYHRDEALANGFSYDKLIQEMAEALAGLDSEFVHTGPGITGQCWIHPQARIKDQVTIDGPCIVCKGAELGPRVYLGAGTVVGPYAKLGLGVAATATIIGAQSKIKYETSISHTVIGEYSDISETVAVASARQHPSPVTSWTKSGQPLQTDLPKLGAQIGAHAKISANSLIMPGSVIHNEVNIRNSVVNGCVTPLENSRKSAGDGQIHGRRSGLTSRTTALVTLLLVATLLGGLLIREALLLRPSSAPPRFPDPPQLP